MYSDDESTLFSKQGLLFWWKTLQNDFSILSRVACLMLAIPASTAKSQRNFSDLRTSIIKKRNQQLKLDDRIFLGPMHLLSIVYVATPPNLKEKWKADEFPESLWVQAGYHLENSLRVSRVSSVAFLILIGYWYHKRIICKHKLGSGMNFWCNVGLWYKSIT